MSKKMDDSELQNLIDANLDYCKNTLKEFSESSIDKVRKKAMLVAYWLKDYFRMLKKENSQEHMRLPKYKRGQVLSVNFGFRIGNELGGRHFAIVLDNNNSTNSDIITVLPLTSKKEHTKIGWYNYELQFDLVELYKERFELLLKQNSNRVQNLLQRIHELENNTSNPSESSLNDDLSQIKNDYHRVTESIKNMESINEKISKLKSGSIVNLSQITTISKQRILNPKQSKDALTGIRVKDSDLDEISKKLKHLYKF